MRILIIVLNEYMINIRSLLVWRCVNDFLWVIYWVFNWCGILLYIRFKLSWIILLYILYVIYLNPIVVFLRILRFPYVYKLFNENGIYSIWRFKDVWFSCLLLNIRAINTTLRYQLGLLCLLRNLLTASIVVSYPIWSFPFGCLLS